jgi:hypothetical protein
MAFARRAAPAVTTVELTHAFLTGSQLVTPSGAVALRLRAAADSVRRRNRCVRAEAGPHAQAVCATVGAVRFGFAEHALTASVGRCLITARVRLRRPP